MEPGLQWAATVCCNHSHRLVFWIEFAIVPYGAPFALMGVAAGVPKQPRIWGKPMTTWQQVIDRANTDLQFRSRLKSNPAAVCKEAGVEIPEDATFEVIECTGKDIHLLLGTRTNIPEVDKILEGADDDAGFRSQLLNDPKSALQAATGETVPAQCKVHVREADPKAIYIYLPNSQAADGELSESELEAVAGGFLPGWGPIVAGLTGFIFGAGAGKAATWAKEYLED